VLVLAVATTEFHRLPLAEVIEGTPVTETEELTKYTDPASLLLTVADPDEEIVAAVTETVGAVWSVTVTLYVPVVTL
jgi:hypothetical protein